MPLRVVHNANKTKAKKPGKKAIDEQEIDTLMELFKSNHLKKQRRKYETNNQSEGDHYWAATVSSDPDGTNNNDRVRIKSRNLPE